MLPCTLLLLVGFHLESGFAKRDGVVKKGTTFPPDFRRATVANNKPLERCPALYPFVFDGGQHCCATGVKKYVLYSNCANITTSTIWKAELNNTSLAADCDGGRLYRGSSLECCAHREYVECPDRDRGCNNHPDPPARPNATVIWWNDVYALNFVSFDPKYVLTVGDQCDKYGTYWVANDYFENASFVVDFGAAAAFDRMTVRNTADRFHNWSGTKNFTMETSYDQKIWHHLFSGMLEDVKDIDWCERPFVTLDVRGFGRYFRFTALSYYFPRAGLNYISWRFI